MRTTLDLDEDILLAAKSIANRKGQTIGRVVSDLLRDVFKAKTTGEVKHGVPLLPVKKNSQLVTMELVNKLRDGEET